MTDTMSCPECESEIDSADDLEQAGSVTTVETTDSGSINLYESRDLFLCSGCRKPLGVSR